MLEKHLYDSWKSRLELYMMNRPHGRMILASVEKGPLVWPSITEDGVTRLKEYVELTPAEAIQADCDIKAINIILQGLPTKIYALGRQTTYVAGTTRKYTPGASGSNTGKQRYLSSVTNAKGGSYCKQCTKPRGNRDGKHGSMIKSGLPDIQTLTTIITHNADYQRCLDAYDSDCDELQTQPRLLLMANLSRNGSACIHCGYTIQIIEL
ncbi:hypothetical protein Tco_0109738 [Tanacetum coccineum]